MAVFSVDYFPYVGGAEVAVREICRRLPAYDCIVITCRNDQSLPRRFHDGTASVVRVGFGIRCVDKYVFPVFALFAARRMHAKDPFCGVWAMMANTAGIAAALFKAFNAGIFYVLSVQEGDSDAECRARTRFWKPLYRFVHAKADAVVAVSEFLKRRTRALGYAGPVFVVKNGIDDSVFRLAPSPVIPPRPSLITVSRLERKNGLRDLFRAFSLLPASADSLTLTVVGDGSEEPALRTAARTLGISDRVTFAGGVPHADVPRYLHGAEVFVRPSLSEGFGNVFLEAMACGIPVIGTHAGAIPEIVVHERNGLLCEAGNPRSIADAIIRMLGDSALRKRCAEAGILTAAQYSWEGIAARYGAIFDSLP